MWRVRGAAARHVRRVILANASLGQAGRNSVPSVCEYGAQARVRRLNNPR